MPRTRPSRSPLFAAALVSLLLLAPLPLVSEQWRTVDGETFDVLIEEPTRLKQIDPVLAQLSLPSVSGHGQKITTLAQLFPVDPTQYGLARAKGKGRVTATCFGNQQQHNLGTRTNKVDRHGNVAFTFEVDSALGCDLFQVRWNFLKRFELPAGIAVEVGAAVELLDDQADRDCLGDQVLCLNRDRFQVEVDWRDFDDKRGSAIAFPRTDQSGTFFFFDPDNTEMLLKVLDGCRSNGHYWVFYAATTNVEYSISVTDTLSGQSRLYDNPLGRPAPAVIDTQAFATCP